MHWNVEICRENSTDEKISKKRLLLLLSSKKKKLTWMYYLPELSEL